jgi:HSP20 family protein
MPLVPFEPFRHVEQWKKDLDKMLNESIPAAFGFQGLNSPRTDVYETGDYVIVHCEIAGLEKKEDVHIHVDNQSVTIHGTINKFNEVKEEQVHRQERYSGNFQRTVGLPSPVTAEGTTASYKNGILEVRMPKVKQDTGPKIDVDFQ